MRAIGSLIVLVTMGLRAAAALDAPVVAVQAAAAGDSVHVRLTWEPFAGATSYQVSGRSGWLDAAAPVAWLDTCGVDLPWANPQGLFEVVAESFLPEVVTVPAGTFLMGSGEIGNVFHQVTLTHDYELARTETTNAEYLDALNWAWAQGGLAIGNDPYTDMDWVMQGGSLLLPVSRAANHDDLEIVYDAQADRFILHAGTLDTNTWGPGHAFPDGYDPARHPIKYVTWMGAAAYCDWLSLRDGLPTHYNNDSNHDPTVHSPFTAQGWRLPTEAEWERAARFDDQRLYPWGNEAPSCERVNYRYPGYCVGWSEEVGSHPLGDSALGLHDLAGNEMEWCNDYATPITSADPVIDPPGPSGSGYRGLRNGHWRSFSNGHMRATWRAQSMYNNGYDDVGFRVCRITP